MAHKSKTQRAKAAAAKQNRKDRQEREALAGITSEEEQSTQASEKGAKLTRAEKKEAREKLKKEAASSKKETKPKKVRFQFLQDVRAEMKRVTWPSRTDVLRWSGVVVGALLFFGIYVAVWDNLIITPGLWALSNLGA